MADDPDFGVAATLDLSVSDAALRSTRRQIEEELGDAEVDIAPQEFTVADTLGDGGVAGVGAAGSVSTAALLEEQNEVLEDIHDELEQGAVSGGSGLVGGAGAAGVAGRFAALGGFGGGAGLGLSLLLANQASVAATGEGAYQAGSLPEDTDAADLGPVEEFIASRASGIDLGIGRPLQPFFSGAVETLRSPPDSGPENAQSATAEQGTPPASVSVEDLVGVSETELGLGGAGSGGASGMSPDEIAATLEGGFLPESAISEFTTAVDTFASQFPLAARRTETVGGDMVPSSPVAATGRTGIGQGPPRGRRGRLSPGPNSGQGTGLTNRSAERKARRPADVDVNVTVNADGVSERELERAVEDAKRKAVREIRRKISRSQSR